MRARTASRVQQRARVASFPISIRSCPRSLSPRSESPPFSPRFSAVVSKEERGERVPVSQYLDRRSRGPVPTRRDPIDDDERPLRVPRPVPRLPPPRPLRFFRKIDRDSPSCERTRAYGVFRKFQRCAFILPAT